MNKLSSHLLRSGGYLSAAGCAESSDAQHSANAPLNWVYNGRLRHARALYQKRGLLHVTFYCKGSAPQPTTDYLCAPKPSLEQAGCWCNGTWPNNSREVPQDAGCSISSRAVMDLLRLRQPTLNFVMLSLMAKCSDRQEAQPCWLVRSDAVLCC